MPIVIRQNGALNNITEGLNQGIEMGSKLAATKAAIEDAKLRREQETRRLDLEQAGQTFNQGIQKGAQDRLTVDRARIQQEREAGQTANARAMGQVEQGVPFKPPPLTGSIYGAASGLGKMASDHAAQVYEAQNVARHMDPEQGAAYVKSEEQRVRKIRGDALRPKLIDAWTKSLSAGQAQPDPNNPGAAVYQDPKALARAQANIQGLQDGSLDVETSMSHFQAQQADIVNRRNDINLRSTYTKAIQNRLARMEEVAQTNPELEHDLLDRVHEAQGYLDVMNDPAVEPGAAKDYYDKAMAAMHGRGTSSSTGKKARSMYSEARAMAQEDVKALGLPPSTAGEELDRRTEEHLKRLQDEANPKGASKGGEDRFGWSLELSPATEDPAPSGLPATTSPQGQGAVPPGAGGASGGASPGAQVSSAPPPDEDVAGWSKAPPAQRDTWLTQIDGENHQRAVQIAARLGLGSDKQTQEQKYNNSKDELTRRLKSPTSKSQMEADWKEYEKRYGGLPIHLREEAQAAAEGLPE